MNQLIQATLVLATTGAISSAAAAEATIHINAKDVAHEVSLYMTGACIEDVNHEIYGGIYSQMIFGESFQEPALVAPPAGFTAYGGTWGVKDGELRAAAGEGPKLIVNDIAIMSGQVGVELRFRDGQPGNAGLILKVDKASRGADNFVGYEVSLNPERGTLVFGRHRHNWEPLQEVPCKVPLNKWIALSVRMTERALEVLVDGQHHLSHDDKQNALLKGSIGLRTWQRAADFRNLWVKTAEQVEAVPFHLTAARWSDGVSGMWRALRRGSAEGSFATEADHPFVGIQSQRITFSEGDGELGIENQGLNRWGMCLVADKPYEGYLWARAAQSTRLTVALESGDGTKVYAEMDFEVETGDWRRLDFRVTPRARDESARFAIKLKQPGSVSVGHAFLQSGEWGRFKGLPVRRDVAEGLIEQGLTVMRMGGLMANAPEYRWKNMLGPRDRRPPYKGYWYPYSSNGWGIIEFLDFCEAAKFLAIPDFNMDETPGDLGDFVEYVNGDGGTLWGRRRVENGHPTPYDLKYIQLGNEEAVDEQYWQKFKPLAEAIWKKDPRIVVIVGDFEYKQPIIDPHKFAGAPKISSLAAHKKILDLAKSYDRSVWFDVHIWNHEPRDAEQPIAALKTFIDSLAKLSPEADFKVCVLEENSGNHAVRRALAHAQTINGLMRLGDWVRVVCAANALQPHQQNDNGWDQGLLFLDPCRVWGQPPYYVTQMVAKNYLPKRVQAKAQSPGNALDVVAMVGTDGRELSLQVVNLGNQRLRTRIQIDGFKPEHPVVHVTQLSGELDETNTPEDFKRVVPRTGDEKFEAEANGTTELYFPPRSFTVLRFKATAAAQ